MNRTAFDLFHPVVALAYFVAWLVLGMSTLQPVYVVLAAVTALVYRALLAGWRAVGRALAWQVPAIALLACANALFSSMGSTELLRIGPWVLYVESLVYGACMGGMLVSVLLSFANAAHVLTRDKIMSLLGNGAPVVALTVSMTARLVPQLARRGRDIGDVQRACTAARPAVPAASAAPDAPGAQPARLPVREGVRIASVLMGWSMEDSLETADAMRARGWGAAPRRTTYTRYCFRATDAAALVVVLVLAAASAAAAWTAVAQFHFYPIIGGFAPWWSYAPFVLFACVPCILEVRERIAWR